MTWTLYHRWMWFWCWLCYRAYMALPMPDTYKSRYGRFNLWLLGYAGCYANCETREAFGECSFFKQASTHSVKGGYIYTQSHETPDKAAKEFEKYAAARDSLVLLQQHSGGEK